MAALCPVGSVSPFLPPCVVQPLREPFGSGVTLPERTAPAKSSDVVVVPLLGPNSTGASALHADALLCCDYETSAEPHLGAQDHKAGQEPGPTRSSICCAANARSSSTIRDSMAI